MNRPEITSASVFPKLSLILNEDIEVLDRMMGNMNNGSDLYKLLDSLKYAKGKILEKIISDHKRIGNSPTPAQKIPLVGHDSSTKLEGSSVVSAFAKVELTQMEFVRNAVVEEGLPEQLLEKLKEILSIYENITEQLERSSKTRQLNSIVI